MGMDARRQLDFIMGEKSSSHLLFPAFVKKHKVMLWLGCVLEVW